MVDGSHHDGTYPSPGRAWYLVIILSLGLLLSYTDRLIINLVVEDIRSDLGLDYLAISLLQGLGFALIYALAGLPMGRIADRTNRRNLVILGLAIWSVATMACGLAQNFAQFFVFRMVVGLGEAILMPAAASMIADSFPAQTRGRAMGAFGIGAVLGSGIAMTIGAWLLAGVRSGLLDGVGILQGLAPWRVVMIVAGMPGILAIPLFLLLREPLRHDRAGFQPLSHVLTVALSDRGRVARTAIAIGVIAAGDYGLLSWLPTLLERDHGMSPVAVGGIMGAVLGIGGVTACIAGGWLSDVAARRAGLRARSGIMLGSYGMCAVGALLCLAPGVSAIILAFVLWIVGSVAGCVVGNTMLQESVPNEMRATTSAFTTMCSAMIGLGVGPTAVVMASKIIGSEDGALRIGIAIVCLVASALALALLYNPAPASSSAPAGAGA